MTNHYSALVNIKSTMNTSEAPPQYLQKRVQSAKPNILSAEQWKEQRETFRRCQVINAEVDHFPPKTFMNLRDKLAKNKAAKRGDFEDREHQRNLQALRARI